MNPEYWLSLDLSSQVGTLSVHLSKPDSPPKLLKETTITDAFEHSERLIQVLSETLDGLGMDIGQISRFLVPLGPGSYTGLRIAAASVKAFAMALNTPIETVNGSEARAIAWAMGLKSEMVWDDVFVITHIALDKFVKAHFRAEKGNRLILRSEAVVKGMILEEQVETAAVLLDDRTPPDLVPTDDSVENFIFPLRARHLAESLLTATSRKTFKTLEEWIQFAPQYFGDTKY